MHQQYHSVCGTKVDRSRIKERRELLGGYLIGEVLKMSYSDFLKSAMGSISMEIDRTRYDYTLDDRRYDEYPCIRKHIDRRYR